MHALKAFWHTSWLSIAQATITTPLKKRRLFICLFYQCPNERLFLRMSNNYLSVLLFLQYIYIYIHQLLLYPYLYIDLFGNHIACSGPQKILLAALRMSHQQHTIQICFAFRSNKVRTIVQNPQVQWQGESIANKQPKQQVS